MGLTKYDAKKFMFFNVIASALWAVIVGYAAYVMGEVILTYTDDYKYVGVAIILTIVFGTAYYLKRI
jgi:membrane protein DedA with SNARE-associated domain